MVNIIEAIGNVVESVEIGGVLYTLASDGVVRVNDADTMENVERVKFASFAYAEAAYRGAIERAKAVA